MSYSCDNILRLECSAFSLAASFPNAFSGQSGQQLQQQQANSPAGKQTEGTSEAFTVAEILEMIVVFLRGRSGRCQPLHLPPAAGVFRPRPAADVHAVRNGRLSQGLHRQTNQSQQVFRSVLPLPLKNLSHIPSLYMYAVASHLLQVSWATTTRCRLSKPSKPWTAFKSAWRDSRCSWSERKTTPNPTRLNTHRKCGKSCTVPGIAVLTTTHPEPALTNASLTLISRFTCKMTLYILHLHAFWSFAFTIFAIF